MTSVFSKVSRLGVSRWVAVLAAVIATALLGDLIGAGQASAATRTVSVAAGGEQGGVVSDPPGIKCLTAGDPHDYPCFAEFDENETVTLHAIGGASPNLLDPGAPLSSMPGYGSTGWNGDCIGLRECRLVMDRDREVSIDFFWVGTTPSNDPGWNLGNLVVQPTHGGKGTVTPSPLPDALGNTDACDPANSPCRYTYDRDETVTLTAVPDSGFAFTGWYGDCEGLYRCEVKINRLGRNVWASFTPIASGTSPLVAFTTGDGWGRVTSDPAGISCGNECYLPVTNGETVTLTAEPEPGSVFTGWNGACTGMALTCRVDVDGARSVWASFSSESDPAYRALAVHRAGTAEGSVTSQPKGIECGNDCHYGHFEAGSTVTLTATPKPGQVFNGWSGACVGTDPVCEVTMDGSKAVWATFSQQTQAFGADLAVIKVGSGQGWVGGPAPGMIGPGPGIDCGFDCHSQFEKDANVPLTATPEPGSVFTGWNGACSGMGACSVKLDATKTVWASFSRIDDPGNQPLTVFKTGDGNGNVTSDPDGIDCPSAGGICEQEFPDGSSVTLTATANPGSVFMGWQGACEGLGDCELTMDAPQSVWAKFVQYDPDGAPPLNRPPLLVFKPGDGSGTVTSDPAGIECGSTCAARFDPDEVVTLTAAAAPGSEFMGWGGACQGTGDTCEVEMSGLQSVEAHFVLYDPVANGPNTQPLLVLRAGSGQGKVTGTPGSIDCGIWCFDRFDAGTEVTLTATASAGSVFMGWTGACEHQRTNCVLKMDGPRAVWAVFAKYDPNGPAPWNKRPLQVFRTGDGQGSVSSSPGQINCGLVCSDRFDSGTEVTLTATAKPGSVFLGWSGACEGLGQCELTMDGPRSVWAMFAKYDPNGPVPYKNPPLQVYRTGDGEGLVSSEPGQIACGSSCFERFNVNTQVTLTATPKPGSVFAGWSGDCDGVGACTVKMDGPKAVWARFVPDPGPGPSHVLTVTKSTTGSGTVTSSPAGIECGSTCSAAFAENAKVTLTATADSGSVFSGWSGACTGAAVSCEVTMDQARTVTATFTAVGPGPGPGPKPPVPVNPPNDGTAIFDPVTGKLKIRLKCTNRFRPRCLKMVAWAVTGKGKKAKQMTKGPRAKVKNRRAGKWKLATLTVKPKFRQRVADMGKVDRKSLWVRIKVTGKKKVRVKVRRKGKVRWVKRRTVTIHHRYRVLVR